MPWADQVEQAIRDKLAEKIQGLESELQAKYQPIIESVACISRDLFDGLIIGAEIDEELKILEATLLNLASAGTAITVREAKEAIKDVATTAFEIMVKAAIGALGV